MKLRPLGNRLLVQRAAAKTSKGGIILPETAQEKPKEGKVLACGPGKMSDAGEIEPMNVKVGDTVLFTAYAGTQVKDNEELLILSEDEVLAIVG